jgi:hypothetical protein
VSPLPSARIIGGGWSTEPHTRERSLPPEPGVRAPFGGKDSAPKGCGNSAARVRPEGAQECSHGWSPGLPGRNPWSFCENVLPPRMGRRQFNCCTRAPAVEHSSAPDGAGSSLGIGAHGFRSCLPALASPVATVLGPIRGRRKCHGPGAGTATTSLVRNGGRSVQSTVLSSRPIRGQAEADSCRHDPGRNDDSNQRS